MQASTGPSPVPTVVSSSAAESQARPTRVGARRRIPKFVEHIDETTDDDTSASIDRTANLDVRSVPFSEPEVRVKVEEEDEVPILTKDKPADASYGHLSDKAVDGWKLGMDHKVDHSGHFEFL